MNNKNNLNNHNMTPYQRHWFVVLNIMKKQLSRSNIKLCTTEKDDRINSAHDEELVLNIIKAQFIANRGLRKRYNLTIPEIREWFDFKIETKNNNIKPAYVNIKTSNMCSADNLNCKLGIHYTLTGNESLFSNSIGWSRYFKNLSSGLDFSSITDYFFMIINKIDTSDVLLTSLRSIETLTPNGNNLPFQCNWKNNRIIRCMDNKEEELVYILDMFKRSLELGSKKLSAYLDYIDPKLRKFRNIK